MSRHGWSLHRFLPVAQKWYGLDPKSDTRTWTRVVETARTDGVAGLLWEALNALPTHHNTAPHDVVEQLTMEVEHTRATNHAAFQRFAHMYDRLRSEGVEVLVLKGAALTAALYNNHGLRPMCDIDLLIHVSDASTADAALNRVGYRRGRAFLTHDFYPRYNYEADYAPVDGFGPRLDVHVRPWRPLRCSGTVTPDALWANPREVSLCGTTIAIPGNEDMLLHLACHTAYHGADRLLWLAEIDRYIHRYGQELDWDLLISRAEQWSMGHAAWSAFRRVEQLFGPTIPDQIRQQLTHSGSWRDRLTTWQSSRDSSHPLMRTMVDMLVTPNISFKMGYLAAVLFPENTHLCPDEDQEDAIGEIAKVRSGNNCASRGGITQTRRIFALTKRALGAIR